MVKIKGVIQYRRGGRKYIDVVVAVTGKAKPATYLFGIDTRAERGKIITFLAAMYSVRPGEIVWPSHIEPESGVL